jgi:hypothetical protein
LIDKIAGVIFKIQNHLAQAAAAWFTVGWSRIWWNWQTRYFEVVVPQGVQVQVLLCAPFSKKNLELRASQKNICFIHGLQNLGSSVKFADSKCKSEIFSRCLAR